MLNNRDKYTRRYKYTNLYKNSVSWSIELYLRVEVDVEVSKESCQNTKVVSFMHRLQVDLKN